MIPDELKSLNQWVCVKMGSKVPMRADIPSPASSSDPQTWADYGTARSMVNRGIYDNLGFVFHNNGIVGIDIDCGYTPEGILTPVAADIIGKCGSYTEYSRSGRGFHIFVKGTLPFSGRNNHHGVEIYQDSRYFIMTGNTVVFDKIIYNQEAIDYVLDTYFPEVRTIRENPRANVRVYNPKWNLPTKGRIRLRPDYPTIPPGSRNICLTSLAGMLHSLDYTKEMILDEVTYANSVACKPPLDQREVRAIVNSVMRYKR